MSVIVFAVGRPGSGKSTAIRHIIELAKNKKYVAIHIRDYTILHAMSKQEEHYAKFRPNKYEGFDVVDFSVLDIALCKLEEQINVLIDAEEYDIILVEFARDDYKTAFKKFSPTLLKNSYILFVEAELNTCIERVRERAVLLHGPDHHFLSTNIMTTYYRQDHRSYMENLFEDDFRLEKNHYLKTIYNDSSVEKLEEEAGKFTERVFQEVHCQRSMTIEESQVDLCIIPVVNSEEVSQEQVVDVATVASLEVFAIA